MPDNTHKEVVVRIIHKHFGAKPKSIKRMKTGICNEVYVVKTKDQEVVVRFNKDNDEMKGSEKYIPLFRSKGIKVPKIIASDYSRKSIPYYYQIQSKIEGQDIFKVISKLSSRELKALAKEIARIFKKLLPIPTNGKFGFAYAKESWLKKSLTIDLKENIETAIQRGTASGVLNKNIKEDLERLFVQHKPYFDTVRSKFYYDDMCSKNVMIHKGKFSGLVDLDGVSYGDYLQTVGCIKASWYGTKYGTIYANAVMDELKLSKKQREIVTVYALFNRVSWMCENGVQFNQNTKGVVDWKKAKNDMKVVQDILKEF